MKKILLLDRRMQRPLAYPHFFETATTDTVWKKLYGVRSSIAHGSDPDFQSEVSVLHSLEHATRFLRLATSAILLCSLREPALVSDLREC